MPLALAAQTTREANRDDDRGWISLGVGTGADWDLASSVNLNYGRETFFQCALHRLENFSIGNNPNHIHSVSVGIGHATVSPFSRLAFSAGLSFLFGKRYDDILEKNTEFKTVGLLLNTQIAFTPIREAGIGLDMFINLNKEQKTGGVTLTLFIEGNK